MLVGNLETNRLEPSFQCLGFLVAGRKDRYGLRHYRFQLPASSVVQQGVCVKKGGAIQSENPHA